MRHVHLSYTYMFNTLCTFINQLLVKLDMKASFVKAISEVHSHLGPKGHTKGEVRLVAKHIRGMGPKGHTKREERLVVSTER